MLTRRIGNDIIINWSLKLMDGDNTQMVNFDNAILVKVWVRHQLSKELYEQEFVIVDDVIGLDFIADEQMKTGVYDIVTMYQYEDPSIEGGIATVTKGKANVFKLISSNDETELIDDNEDITIVTIVERGMPGNDGTTPHIGSNGNWWIGEVDTGVFAGYVESNNDMEKRVYDPTNIGGDVFDYNNFYNTPEIPTIPTKVSAFENDKGYLTEHQDISGKADKSELFSGSYNDLSDTPEIPTIPTKVSAFENDKGYLTEHQDISGKADKSELFSGSYNDLSDTPEIPVIPTKVSAFENDKGYLTEHQDISDYAKKSELFSGSYNDLSDTPEIPSIAGLATEEYVDNKIDEIEIPEDVDLSNYAKKSELPTKTSQLTNDSGYLTEHQDISGKADKSELFDLDYNKLENTPTIPTIPTKVSAFENDKGYLTQHQDISGKADKSELPTKVSDLTNDEGYLTEHQDISGKANKSDIKITYIEDSSNEIELNSIFGSFILDKSYDIEEYEVTGEPIIGAWVKIHINTGVEPTVVHDSINVKKIKGSEFIENGDMYLLIQYNGKDIEYYLAEINEDGE